MLISAYVPLSKLSGECLTYPSSISCTGYVYSVLPKKDSWYILTLGSTGTTVVWVFSPFCLGVAPFITDLFSEELLGAVKK